MDAMASLSLAIKSLLGWAWDIFSINIPILNIPFWVIAMAAVAVDLHFISSVGSSARLWRLPRLSPKERKVKKNENAHWLFV